MIFRIMIYGGIVMANELKEKQQKLKESKSS